MLLVADIGAAGLDAAALGTFLAGFLQRLRAWRDVLARWDDRVRGEPVSDPLLAMRGAVRA